MLLKKVEKEYFTPLKIISQKQEIDKNNITDLARCLFIYKYEFKVEYIDV